MTEAAPPPYSGPPPTGRYQYPPSPPPAPYPPAGPYPPPGVYPGGYPGPYGMYAGRPIGRPGVVTAAAVIGWVLAGLLILAAGLLFFGAAFLRDFDAVNGTHTGGYVAEFTVDALVDVALAGLLIAGGVGLTNRSTSGRMLHTVAGTLVLVAACYWLGRWGGRSGGAITGYGVIFAASATIAVLLSWTGAAGAWLHSGQHA